VLISDPGAAGVMTISANAVAPGGSVSTLHVTMPSSIGQLEITGTVGVSTPNTADLTFAPCGTTLVTRTAFARPGPKFAIRNM
jgi:hypothetical protein